MAGGLESVGAVSDGERRLVALARGSSGWVVALLVLGAASSDTVKVRATETVGDRCGRIASVPALLDHARAVELARRWGSVRAVNQ